MALALALAADAAVIVVYVALMVIIGGARLNWEVFVVMPILAAVYFASLTGPMLIARRLGYRLLCGFGQPPSDSPA
jgi:cell division protein FtsW (lipid II flippase)